MEKVKTDPIDEETKANLDILKALDEAIEKGPWEHNLFFRGIGKKLRDIRDRFERELGLGELRNQLSGSSDKRNAAPTVTTSDQFTTVYISLYQAEGSNLQKWASVITNLTDNAISRPVYKNEEDIQAAIRAKEYKLNDGFIAVNVPHETLVKPFGDKPPLDRFGRELLVLKENAVKIENILYFVHVSGRYTLRGNTLVRQSD